jgi:hypothetical protein
MKLEWYGLCLSTTLEKITWPNIETFYYFQSGFTDLQGLNFAGDVDNWMG